MLSLKEQKSTGSQIERFRELARELGCDEDEAAFEVALKKLAESAPLPKHEPKKRDSKNGNCSPGVIASFPT